MTPKEWEREERGGVRRKGDRAELESISSFPTSLLTGRRDIQGLAVMCSSVDLGCEWVGTVGTLEKHVATCGFTLVPCSKQCKDNKNEVQHFMRKHLDEHLEHDCPNRDYKCSHCGEKDTYAKIQIHDSTCGKKEVPCPNAECSSHGPRDKMGTHVEAECPFAVVPCKFQSIGCEMEMPRKDMAAHEQDDKQHLHLALNTVVQLKATAAEVEKLQGELKCANGKLKELQDTMANSDAAVERLQEELKYTRDTVTSFVTTEPQSKNWRTFVLTGYRGKRRNNAELIFPPFYTSPNGYHVALEVDANGCGEFMGTCVSVHIHWKKGKYDAALKWPFIGKVIVTLLNQLEDEAHDVNEYCIHAKDNILCGGSLVWHTFIPHSALTRTQKTQYLMHDTLYFRMSVEEAGCRPWLLL